MSSNHQRQVKQTLFIRSIENGLSHKAKICFKRLVSLPKQPVSRTITTNTQVSVGTTFKTALLNAATVKVPKPIRRGLELLIVVVSGASSNFRTAFDAIITVTRQSTKRDIGRIMRLLSKKFLTRVDDKFLSEHIKLLILKNKIQNPSILTLVKQNDIEISTEDYAEEAKIKKTEMLLQVFLATELFLPVDLWVSKIKETYNRMFFRLLRAYGANREAEIKRQKLGRMFGIFEAKTGDELRKNWNEMRDFVYKSRAANVKKAAAVEALVKVLDAAVQARKLRELTIMRNYNGQCRLAKMLGKLEQRVLRTTFDDIMREALKPRKAKEILVQTNEQLKTRYRTKEIATGTSPLKTDIESFMVFQKKAVGEAGSSPTDTEDATGQKDGRLTANRYKMTHTGTNSANAPNTPTSAKKADTKPPRKISNAMIKNAIDRINKAVDSHDKRDKIAAFDSFANTNEKKEQSGFIEIGKNSLGSPIGEVEVLLDGSKPKGKQWFGTKFPTMQSSTAQAGDHDSEDEDTAKGKTKVSSKYIQTRDFRNSSSANGAGSERIVVKAAAMQTDNSKRTGIAAQSGDVNLRAFQAVSSEANSISDKFATSRLFSNQTSQGVAADVGFDKKRFKKLFQSLESMLQRNKFKNMALTFEKIGHECIKLEVITITDLTKDLEPVQIQVIGPGLQTSVEGEDQENVSAHRRSQILDASSYKQGGNAGEVAYIRNSHLIAPEQQILRYSQVYKPKAQLLEQMAESRKEDEFKRSFNLGTAGFGGAFPRSTRNFINSMILEPSVTFDVQRRSFMRTKDEEKVVKDTGSGGGAKGLRARYK